MRVGVIGRTEILYDTCKLLLKSKHDIAFIITSKEAPEYSVGSAEFRDLANQLSVPFMHSANIMKAFELIKNCGNVDIAVSLNYSGIIPKVVTDHFPLGVLNAHGGDLPRYRGNACQAWAILNGENKIGLCIHRMIGGELDNGDIIDRDYFPIDNTTKIGTVYKWIHGRVPKLFLASIDRLENSPDYILEQQSKNPIDALRCYPLRPEDGRIDWNHSCVEIIRVINAFNKPFGGAFCYFEGQKIVVWNAEITPTENYLAIPGQITFTGNGYIEVASKQGKLRITEISVDDKSVVPSDLIKSIRKRLN